MKLMVGGGWGPRAAPLVVHIGQAVSFARRLQDIHPLFAEISPKGNRGGYKNMLMQPLIWDMTPEQWEETFEHSRNRDGSFVYDEFGYTVEYWNRHTRDEECIVYQIHCNDTRTGNGVSLANLPQALNTPDFLEAIMLAIMEVFDTDNADICRIVKTDKAPPGFSLFRMHWKTWVKQGGSGPWPYSPDWEQAICGEPATAEPWHGGTLYIWPQYAPWLPLPAV